MCNDLHSETFRLMKQNSNHSIQRLTGHAVAVPYNYVTVHLTDICTLYAECVFTSKCICWEQWRRQESEVGGGQS